MARGDEAEQSALFEAGRRAWPGLGLSREALLRHLSSCGGRVAPAHAADFYLACACAEGVPGAVEAFERAYLGQLGAMLAPLRPAPTLVEEVGQVLCEKLFVGKPGQAPKIAGYDGRGTLSTWLRVIALRAAIDLLRQGGVAAPRGGEEEDDEEDPATADAEGSYLKQRYRRPFNEAIRRSMASVAPEQRELLRLHFVDGLGLDELAARLGVHRATIARRLAAARKEIRSEARRLLRTELGVTDRELDSLAGLLRSQLELSWSALQDRG